MVADVVLGEPDYRLVTVLLDEVIDRKIGRRPVMGRPVELYAARDPRAEHTDKRRLDNVLTVEHILSGGLVDGAEHPPAKAWEKCYRYVIVLDDDSLKLALSRLIRGADVDGDGVGIGISKGALMDAVLREDRQSLGLALRVYRYLQKRFCDFYWIHFYDHSFRSRKFFRPLLPFGDFDLSPIL